MLTTKVEVMSGCKPLNMGIQAHFPEDVMGEGHYKKPSVSSAPPQ